MTWVKIDAARWLTLALACAAIAAVARTPARERYVAVQVEPRTAAELALTLGLSLDVWNDQVDRKLVVVVAAASLAELRDIPHRIVVDDIDAVAQTERARLVHRARHVDWFAEYRDLQEIGEYLDRLAAQHRGQARLHQLGMSVEGRPIRALEISRGGKLAIALNGGQHAREWISVMVPMCLADRLLTSRDPRVREILDEVSFQIVPVVNPDGYHHSWTVDRYWRKNRRNGHGVDLNRNYSVAWGQAGSSDDPQSPNYRGERPFSEPETQAMRTLFERSAIVAHLDFHAFSQIILYPWSHQRAAPADRDRFAAIAARMSAAILATHGEHYEIRPGSELTIGSSGTLGDWAYGEHGALSLLVELRPASGKEGFVLPPEQIMPTCDESLAAVLELATSLIRDQRESTGQRNR